MGHQHIDLKRSRFEISAGMRRDFGARPPVSGHVPGGGGVLRVLGGVLLALFLAGSLAGCMGGAGGLFPGTGATSKSKLPGNAIAVDGGDFIVVGPAGFCVDKSALTVGEAGTFALLSGCPRVLGILGRGTSTPAALTALIGPPVGASFADSQEVLSAFFTSDDGRAALSRAGDAQTVKINAISSKDAVIYIALTDSAAHAKAAGVYAHLLPGYWRALMDVNGRMVTLSVNALRAKPLSDGQGQAILEAFVAGIRDANPPRVSAPVAPTDVAAIGTAHQTIQAAPTFDAPEPRLRP